MRVQSVTFRQLERAGRLGNQLFQVAATVGIARAIGARPCLPSRWSYRPFLNCPVEWFRPSRGRTIEAWQWEGLGYMDERARLYLQDPALFRDVADEIRSAFQPSPKAERLLFSGAYSEFTGRAYEAIAIHVRRGDLLTQEQGYQPTLTVDCPGYYKAALHSIDNWMDRPVWVFSDDPDWCEANMGELLMVQPKVMRWNPPRSHVPAAYRRQEPKDWADLLLMSMAADLVMSNSTFAFWAAYLSRSLFSYAGGEEWPPLEARYPSLWFGPNLDYIDTDLLFVDLPWRKVPC